MRDGYELLDSGEGRKLERFGDVILSRPCDQADWAPEHAALWTAATAAWDRELGWETLGDAEIPSSWVVTINGIVMKLKTTPAGHLGVFPETRALWDWITEALGTPAGERASVLNLFAYSGGATIAAARAGCSVCHLDSSRSMVRRARENAALNQLDQAPIRWIVDDVSKFLDREIRRGTRYDAIMLDPPSFGRGSKGEQYKLERDLEATLQKCRELLTEEPAFVLLTSHTLGMTQARLGALLEQSMAPGATATGEMALTGAADVRPVESGLWARWSPAPSPANTHVPDRPHREAP